MRASFSIDFDKSSLNKFDASCELLISKVGHATKKGTIAACKELQEMSLAQVPRLTNTLANSCFYKLEGNWREGFKGVVGYGGNGNPINPITGESASSYMVAVHENLNAIHPIGKAKFLEDPAREYAKEHYPRTVFKYIKELFESLGGSS